MTNEPQDTRLSEPEVEALRAVLGQRLCRVIVPDPEIHIASSEVVSNLSFSLSLQTTADFVSIYPKQITEEYRYLGGFRIAVVRDRAPMDIEYDADDGIGNGNWGTIELPNWFAPEKIDILESDGIDLAIVFRDADDHAFAINVDGYEEMFFRMGAEVRRDALWREGADGVEFDPPYTRRFTID